MRVVLIVLLITFAPGAIFLLACALATRLTFGFKWRTILGVEREVKRIHTFPYVSRGPFMPTAIFWLGSTREQEYAVAQAMARGDIDRADFTEAVDTETNWQAILSNAAVWPTVELKQMLGKAEDVIA